MSTTVTKIKKICRALATHYSNLGVHYSDNFTRWCDENGVDDEILDNELQIDNSEIDDCMLIDFFSDEDFQQPEDADAQFNLLKHCYNNQNTHTTKYKTDEKTEEETKENNNEEIKKTTDTEEMKKDAKALLPITINAHLLNIPEQKLDETRKLLKTQCPSLQICNSKGALLIFLAIGIQYKYPFLQFFQDCYAIARIGNAKQVLTAPSTVREWIMTSNNTHVLEFKKINCIHHLQGAMTTLKARRPLMMIDPVIKIDESLRITVQYIRTAIYFIAGQIVGTNNNYSESTCHPFQFDFVITTGRPVSVEVKKSVIGIDDEDDFVDYFGNIKDKLEKNKLSYIDDDDDDDDDDDAEDEDEKIDFVDYVGNIKDKLEKNKLSYIEVVMDTTDDKIGMKQFTDALKTFTKDHGLSRKRVIGLLDRREKDKDTLYIYEPPRDCRDIPNDAVPEWYFNSSKTCILPNSGYQLYAYEENVANNVIGSAFHCKGAVLTFSFHVRSSNEQAVYLYWNGAHTRFLPHQIPSLFPRIFNMKWLNGKRQNQIWYDHGEELNQYIDEMNQKLSDMPFENFNQTS